MAGTRCNSENAARELCSHVSVFYSGPSSFTSTLVSCGDTLLGGSCPGHPQPNPNPNPSGLGLALRSVLWTFGEWIRESKTPLYLSNKHITKTVSKNTFFPKIILLSDSVTSLTPVLRKQTCRNNFASSIFALYFILKSLMCMNTRSFGLRGVKTRSVSFHLTFL